jgi:hypothetical protein
LPFDDERGTVHFIRKVYHDFRLAMTHTNIWGHSEVSMSNMAWSMVCSDFPSTR